MVDLSLVDPAWEMMDPNPNIWSLFAEFDKRFFNGKLTSSFVELMWSTGRMTSTAGLCCWNPRTNFATIKLSQPLLQLRSRADLVETLLHEMIHAFLFVTRQDDNHESHGPKFHIHMFRINKEAGTNITVYHTFHDEVRHYQQHIWRCDGPCAGKAPYYGYVRRANNRKPGSYDYWWTTHQANCGGTFNKIAEPDKTAKPKQNNKGKTVANNLQNNKRIDDFFKISSSPSTSAKTIASSSTITPSKAAPISKSSPIRQGDIRNYISPVKNEQNFPGNGYRLGSSLESNPVKKLKLEDIGSDEVSSSQDIKLSQPVQPFLPDLIPQILNSQTDDDDDSFTYDLPDIEIDDSIIIEAVKEDQLNGQSSQKSTTPEQLNLPTVSKTNGSQKRKTDKDEDEEDVFTYELPNFTPFLGTGFRLGSSNSTKPNNNNNQSLKRGTINKPQIINLD
ncbi:DNA-dependent metalloprotease SPRTN-like [Panonychus citri]|uniref:DNA-dependent metalloprotease SPRTN-like n=1 Tax=Panonychus citri TaxID=50023 RepID=UPI002306E035|nr:DNA-dependent metalloprotease SPRTN-like [Panonychus citri]